ncbi:DNA polymerase Y family protein [Emcibacter sp. SYSU 3D8]|uniref:Y-family DNA polymerase n=1 Tax=Emcibacter sp. SYSU 3D8 TaxID=3133969 RepID=UPI0031FF2B46
MRRNNKKRILTIWFPWLVSERLVRREPELAKQVLAAIEERRGRLVLAAVNRRAFHGGLKPGMVLADARAVQPTLQTRFINAAADRAALVRLANWTMRYTPWTGLAEGDSLFLDISGCAHLFGGEAALAADLVARLKGFGLTPLTAIADTPGAAWAACRTRREEMTILEPFAALTDAMTAMKDFPLTALRLSPDTLDSLTSFGLRTFGALYPLERRALTERFAAEPVQRLDQALGVVDEPISPIVPVPVHEARVACLEPLVTRDGIETGLRRLLEELCRNLTRSGEGARQLTLACYRVDGTAARIRVGTSRPSRWSEPLFRLFYEKLDEVDPGFGVEVMTVSATRVETLKPAQENWQVKGDGAAGLTELVDRLGNRFGFGRIARPAPRQSWLPERAVEDAAPFTATETPGWPTGRERPLRLLKVPEPVEATALVPDDPPMMFRRGGKAYRVRAADGPERLEGEWWLKDEPPRDYYQVEDEDGRRYWLFRQGLYDGSTAPRWFLHGVFA